MDHLLPGAVNTPPLLSNLPSHIMAHTPSRGNRGGEYERPAAQHDSRQGRATTGNGSDRAGGEFKHVSTHPLLQLPQGQAVLSPSNLGLLLRKMEAEGGLSPTPRVPNLTDPRSQYFIAYLIDGHGCSQQNYRCMHPYLASNDWEHHYPHI
jgi:hypothetical protein